MVVGPVDVKVRETLPEVGRTGATGAAVVCELDEVDTLVDVVAAVDTATDELVLLLLLLDLLVVGGEAVTVGLMVINAVEAAAQPMSAHV